MLLTSKYDFTLNSKTCTTATVADPGFSRLNFRHYPHLPPPCPPQNDRKSRLKFVHKRHLSLAPPPLQGPPIGSKHNITGNVGYKVTYVSPNVINLQVRHCTS